MKTLLALAPLAALAGLACAPAGPTAPHGQLSLAVSPLTLEGVSDVTYTLTVENALGATVWSRTVRSSAYGDGAGAVSYVGPCDADANANPNTVHVVIDALEVDGLPLDAAAWMNPAPADDALSRDFVCVADQDVPVQFDLTVARAAQQGFFDVAISFSDVFCSAKLDCKKDVEGVLSDLTLLYNPATGQRDRTAVLGFACTAGPDQATVLHMSPVRLDCASGESVAVDPSAGPGNLDPTFGPAPDTSHLLFQAAVYRGTELLGNNNKLYWNVALGLNADAFGATLARGCALTATATVSDGAFDGGVSPVGTRWPYVDWNVPVYDAAGTYVCAQHEVGGDDGVAVVYSATSGIAFAATFDRLTGDVSTHEGPCDVPHCASGGLCDLATGEPTACDACDYGWGGALCTTYAVSCLSYYQGGATTDGLYTLDPDGDGPLPAGDFYCDMTNGGWTRVALENFDSGSTSGWSATNVLSTCGSYGYIVGGYNVMANGTNAKTYSLANIPHTEAKLNLDYIKVDSWDGERAAVTFGGTEIWGKTLCFCTSSCDICGGNGLSCGSGSWVEERGIPVTGTIAHTTNTVVVAGSSTLNQGADDESFGLDNIVLWVR